MPCFWSKSNCSHLQTCLCPSVRGVLTCVCAEAFADRRHEPDGTLRSRKHPDALIRDPAEAARFRALDALAAGKLRPCLDLQLIRRV